MFERIKRLFKPQMTTKEKIENANRLDPDQWDWKCHECPARGEGTEANCRTAAMYHALMTGHPTGGGVKQ